MMPSPWMLPPPPIDYGSTDALWKDCYQFVYEHLDVMDEDLYHIYVGWVHHTWMVERFDSVPYLHFYGERNTGKTRALDLLNVLCYRPMLSPSVSGAAVYYAMDYYHPTFLLDEFEMYEKMKESKAEVIGVLNAGYRRGQGVYRVGSVSEGNPTLRRFSVFGPKALSSIKELPAALDSRCITFRMVRAYKKIKRLIDKKWAEELRGKMLQYRFDHLFDPLPEDVNPLDLPDGRLIELYYPIDSVAPLEEIKDIILKCAQKQYDVTILKMRQQKAALVYNLLLDMLENEIAVGYAPDTISQKDIREKYNEDLPPQSFERISKQALPGILDHLNMDSVQNKETRLMEVIVNPRSLEIHKNTYVLSHELPRVEKIIDAIKQKRSVVVTLDTLGTLDVEGVGQKGGNSNRETDGGLHGKGNKETSNVSSRSNVSNVSSVSNAGLQEKRDWIYGELSMTEDLVSAQELSERSGMEVGEVERLLSSIAREGRAFSPRIGWWKLSRL